jgi:CheY-like chemotaxis protein
MPDERFTRLDEFSKEGSRKLVLIVDDRPDDCVLLEKMLRRLGVSNPALRLPSGEAAIDYLSASGLFVDRPLEIFPWVLFLDLKMPGKTGFDVLEWISTHRNHAPSTVFVVSELHSFSDINRAYRLGATSYFTKPLSETELRECLRNRPELWEFDTQKLRQAS